ncbi:MAG TPA: DsbA family protein [Polyangiaceae bacterium]|nr:DsbA family protein [Polyangiaceae bacterium]
MGSLELTNSCRLFVAALALSCQPTPSASAPPASLAPAAFETPPPSRAEAEAQPTAQELPVDADDGVWGSALAPVTVLVFTDLQCPFCARAHATLIELERRYGEARLRVVIKHVPLSNHEGAVPAARMAQAVLGVYGRQQFFRFIDHAFKNQDRVASGEAVPLVSELGLDPRKLIESANSAAIGAQVLRDVMLADHIAVPATPHFRINGVGLTGALPSSDLARVINGELAEAEALRKQGMAEADVYAARVRENMTTTPTR